MSLSEKRLQQDCVMWFRNTYVGWIIYHIPNENQHKKINIGVLPGMPDLHIPHANDIYHSVYIEMKTETGKLSDRQIMIHERLRNYGNAVYVCRSLEEFKEVIKINYKTKTT